MEIKSEESVRNTYEKNKYKAAKVTMDQKARTNVKQCPNLKLYKKR